MVMHERSFCLLSLLIPGPKQPGNDIDVYLEPLVNELKLTRDEGARTYDAHLKRCVHMSRPKC